ncbi:MAG: GNAT family N-acetyltransferase [Pseudomonadota bacterium]
MPSDNIEIIHAISADAVAVAAIHRASRAHAMPWLPVVHTPDEDVEYFQKEVLPTQTVYLALKAGLPIGFIAFTQTWLNHLYLDPAHLRVGLGSKLLSFAKAETQSLNLWTFQKNQPARAFYLRHNFLEVEFTDGASNEEKTPDVRMVWIAYPQSAPFGGNTVPRS